MDKPLISVIIPVYNVEKYLDCCLESVTGQTYENLEILLVDDGSLDNSGAICDSWAEKDSRIKVIHQENAGAGAARNAALDISAGEFIGFVDSDDYIAPDFYAHLYDLIVTGADIAECDYLETRENQTVFKKQEGATVHYTPLEAIRGNIQDTVFRQLIWNKLYRREMVEHVRFPVGTTIDDEYFTYKALGNANRLVRSNQVLYAYRQQPDSVMHKPYSIKRLNGIRAKLERLQYLQKNFPELELEAKQELLFSCLYGMQGSLRSLTGGEKEEARSFLCNTVKSLGQITPDGLTIKRKLLLLAIQYDLGGTAQLLNFLIRIHILT